MPPKASPKPSQEQDESDGSSDVEIDEETKKAVYAQRTAKSKETRKARLAVKEAHGIPGKASVRVGKFYTNEEIQKMGLQLVANDKGFTIVKL